MDWLKMGGSLWRLVWLLGLIVIALAMVLIALITGLSAEIVGERQIAILLPDLQENWS
ncbi:MAG: hypothetical protein OXC19_24090 [Bryobacterales bacterium]|nr:hypothetical protein [Bryobacterales bacterium]